MALALGLIFCAPPFAVAQMETNSTVPGPGEISAAMDEWARATNAPATPSGSLTGPGCCAGFRCRPGYRYDVRTGPDPGLRRCERSNPGTTCRTPAVGWTSLSSPSVIGALLALASLGGFLLYQCGLTRAKNSGHASTLLLLGALFALTGYWIGGFAVQTGGIGDAHAALAQAIPPAEKSALDHELGPVALGHHWGLMGSAGFFLATDDPINENLAALFLMQAALMAIAVAAALGASLERGGLRGMTICTFLVGVLIYPFFANWVWGGGWLAELGREFGLGHGFVDLGGAAVVHETAGDAGAGPRGRVGAEAWALRARQRGERDPGPQRAVRRAGQHRAADFMDRHERVRQREFVHDSDAADGCGLARGGDGRSGRRADGGSGQHPAGSGGRPGDFVFAGGGTEAATGTGAPLSRITGRRGGQLRRRGG